MTYKIMSFSGGGVRGLLSLQILVKLEEAHNKLFPGGNLFADPVLFAGTSVGASIAAKLAVTPADKRHVTQLEVDLRRRAYKEFYSDPIGKPSQPAYSDESGKKYKVFIDGIKADLQNKGWPDVTPSRLLLTGYEVTPTATSWGPVLFTNVGATPQGTLVDAVAASCSMPGMLQTYQASTGQQYVDGGFLAHDPTLCAIAQAVADGVALTDIVAINVGTGLMSGVVPAGTDTTSWGAQQWQDSTGFKSVLVQGQPSPVLNLAMNDTTTGFGATLAQSLLGDRFVSINPSIPFIAENDVTQLQTLVDAGRDADLTAAKQLLKSYWN